MDHEGYAVSFLKEVSPGFFMCPDNEDISYPVLRNELVVLREPERVTQSRKFGFKFPETACETINKYFISVQ